MKITETTIEDKAIVAISTEMEAANLERFLVRSRSAFDEIGFAITDEVQEPDNGVTVVGFDLDPMVPEVDLPHVEALLVRLEKRADKKLSETDHPFTLYDFKQTLGIVQDIKANSKIAKGISDFLEGRRTPKTPKPKKIKTIVKTKVKVTGKSVSLKPVPESDAGSDRINKALDTKKAKVDAKNAKARAKVDAELDAKIKATDEAIAAEEALEKEKEDLKKIKKGKTKTKTKK